MTTSVIVLRKRSSGALELLKRAYSFNTTKVGTIVLGIVILTALLGPLFAPYGEDDFVGVPYAAPSADFWLGTDTAGRDVLSRVLLGGRLLLIQPLLVLLVCYAIALPLGITAGFKGGWLDSVLMRPVDLLMSVPLLIFVVVLFTAVGSSPVTLVIGLGVASSPFAVRMIRAQTMEIAPNGYIEYALARGDSSMRVAAREVLPNMTTFLIADATIRLSQTVLAIASLSFLGFGAPPPTADWAVMVNENRDAFSVAPWGVIVPAALIAMLTVGAGLIADGFAAASGRGLVR